MAADKPTFSIIVTSYNYGHFLADALDSVLLQKRDDIQILLIDDASDDDTPGIAERYREHVQYIRNEKNLGAGGAWRVGLELATGKYLIKLDADDELLPGHLDALESAFESDDAVAMVLASVLTRAGPDDTLTPEYICHEASLLSANRFRQKLLECFRFRMPGCAIRREATRGKAGPDPTLFQVHDWEYFLRVTKGHKAVLLPEPTAVYRIHVRSISAVAQQEDRLFHDIRRWLAVARAPGERYIDAAERRVLTGSFACLLLYGFGSRKNPLSYIRFVPVYFRTLYLALAGGPAQVARMHRALFNRALNNPESNP